MLFIIDEEFSPRVVFHIQASSFHTCESHPCLLLPENATELTICKLLRFLKKNNLTFSQ